MKSVIYQIRNIIDNKVYVGSAVDETIRWQQHKRGLIKGVHFNRYLQNSWNKYGEENFIFETLEVLAPDDNYDKMKMLLIERETFYIKHKNAIDKKIWL